MPLRRRWKKPRYQEVVKRTPQEMSPERIKKIILEKPRPRKIQ